MNDYLKPGLVDFIQTAIDLANSVQEDIKDESYISEETVILLNDFMKKHDNLADVLDIMNGVN